MAAFVTEIVVLAAAMSISKAVIEFRAGPRQRGRRSDSPATPLLALRGGRGGTCNAVATHACCWSARPRRRPGRAAWRNSVKNRAENLSAGLRRSIL